MIENEIAEKIKDFMEKMEKESVNTQDVYTLFLQSFLEINRLHHKVKVLESKNV